MQILKSNGDGWSYWASSIIRGNLCYVPSSQLWPLTPVLVIWGILQHELCEQRLFYIIPVIVPLKTSFKIRKIPLSYFALKDRKDVYLEILLFSNDINIAYCNGEKNIIP